MRVNSMGALARGSLQQVLLLYLLSTFFFYLCAGEGEQVGSGLEAESHMMPGERLEYQMKTPSTELHLTYEVIEREGDRLFIKGTARFLETSKDSMGRSRATTSRPVLVEDTFAVDAASNIPLTQTYTSSFWNMHMWHPYEIASFEVSPDLKRVTGEPCKEIKAVQVLGRDYVLEREAAVFRIVLNDGQEDLLWIAEDLPLVARYSAQDKGGRMIAEAVLVGYQEPEAPPAAHLTVGNAKLQLTSSIFTLFNRF